MSFRPIDAIAGALIDLDEKVTPGPMSRLRDWHYQKFEGHIASLTLPELEAKVASYQKLEPAATFIIGILGLADYFGAVGVAAQHNVDPTALLMTGGPGALTISLMSATRGIVRGEELKILTADLSERRAGRIGLAGQPRNPIR